MKTKSPVKGEKIANYIINIIIFIVKISIRKNLQLELIKHMHENFFGSKEPT